MISRPLVSVVDDDESIRESLPDLLTELGFAAMTFSSAEQFLLSTHVDETRCLILDILMPGMSGPELRRELTKRRQTIPVVFITATGDAGSPPSETELGGAVCLFKPFSDVDLLAALEAALKVN